MVHPSHAQEAQSQEDVFDYFRTWETMVMGFGPLEQLFRSLRFQLTFWNTIAILVLVSGALWGVREGVRWTLLRNLDILLTEDMEEVQETLLKHYPKNLPLITEELEGRALTHRQDGWYVRIINGTDNILWSSSTAPTPPNPIKRALPSVPLNVRRHRVLQRQFLLGRGENLLVRIGAAREKVDEDIWGLTEMMLVAFSFIVVAAPLIGYWLAGRATSPLHTILQTTARIQPERLKERLTLRGSDDELDQLSATINGLLDRLDNHLEEQRVFVANAAHELRSPLAAMRTSLEVAMERDRSAAEYRELLADIVEECSGLGNLVNHLLLLAEGDAGLLRPDSKVRLDVLVRRSVDMFQGVAEQRGVRLEIGQLSPVTVRGNDIHLREVIHNLIDNALKFTPKGGRVKVELSTPSFDEVQLCIRDTGIGIPAEDLPNVFVRFYRADKARQRDEPRGGNGLGLSICQAIVHAYGGDIGISSTFHQGTTVIVRLPKSLEVEIRASGREE
jgi:signal transduction histidine kinase